MCSQTWMRCCYWAPAATKVDPTSPASLLEPKPIPSCAHGCRGSSSSGSSFTTFRGSGEKEWSCIAEVAEDTVDIGDVPGDPSK